MLNSMYDLGRLWIDKEGINKIEILLDSNKLNNTKKVLFVNVNIDKGFKYDSITEEDYTVEKNLNYLYKKGSSRGTNLSPSSLITEPKKTFNQKFLKWFDNNSKNDELIKNTFDLLNDNKEEIISDLINKFDNIESDNKRNVILTIRFFIGGEFKYLNDFDIFKDLLFNNATEKYYKLGSKKTRGRSICYLCNESKEVYGLVPSSIGLAFSTADKPGNLPNFNIVNQWKQCSICPDCALYLEAGKKFVEKYLNFSEYGLNYYVIPTIFFNKNMVFDELYDDLIEMGDSKKYNEIVTKEEEFSDIVKDLDDILEFKFLYYKANNNAFDILGYVESVLPSWLQEIYDAQNFIKNLLIFDEDHMDMIFGDKETGGFVDRFKNFNKNYPINSFNWYLGFLRDFFSFTNNKYYLGIVNSIMSKNFIDYDFLLKNIMNVIRGNWRNFDNQNYIMRVNVIKALHLILLFDKLNLFKGGKKLALEDIGEKEILDILNDPDKKACFLLGVLTRKLTGIQYKRLSSTPFINKLWGLNIDKNKIKQTYTMVVAKLTEYESLNFYKEIEKEITLNLIQADSNWNLNKDEISYYFVLGYTVGKDFDLKNKEEVDVDE